MYTESIAPYPLWNVFFVHSSSFARVQYQITGFTATIYNCRACAWTRAVTTDSGQSEIETPSRDILVNKCIALTAVVKQSFNEYNAFHRPRLCKYIFLLYLFTFEWIAKCSTLSICHTFKTFSRSRKSSSEAHYTLANWINIPISIDSSVNAYYFAVLFFAGHVVVMGRLNPLQRAQTENYRYFKPVGVKSPE